MGFWKAIKHRLWRVWTGPVVKDYGEVSNRSVHGARRTLSAVLSENRGRRVYLRESWRGFGAFRINFIELDRDEAMRLKDVLADALREM